MTVGSAAPGEGLLLTVAAEHDTEESEGIAVTFASRSGEIHADLSIGANVAAAVALQANEDIGSRGVQLIGAGFIVTPEEARKLVGWVSPEGVTHHGPGAATTVGYAAGAANPPYGQRLIRDYRNGRDLTDTPRGVQVIDAFGFTAEQLPDAHPAIYQWLLERVKPERDANARATYRDNWWMHGEPRRELRTHLHGLSRYIATVATSKHRFFIFLGCEICPDNAVIAIALNDAAALTILSSCPHHYWSAATGSRLGVGNDSRYIHSRCFETFPFPILNTEQRQTLADLGERLDAHRKRRQAAHAGLTLTGCYNVLVKLRSGEALNAKEKLIHEQALCSILKELHDAIDRTVLAAYGWHDLAPTPDVVNGNAPGDRAATQAALTAELLTRLAALNSERAAVAANTRHAGGTGPRARHISGLCGGVGWVITCRCP